MRKKNSRYELHKLVDLKLCEFKKASTKVWA